MGNLLFITNMEQQHTMMSKAKTVLCEEGLLTVPAEARLLTDAEPWNKAWEKALLESDMILFTWMGTGLNTKFLKQSSEFMQQHNIKHLYLIADPGDDVLEYGLTPAEKTQIQQYITFSGQANYRNLWLWLSCQFSQAACSYEEPADGDPVFRIESDSGFGRAGLTGL